MSPIERVWYLCSVNSAVAVSSKLHSPPPPRLVLGEGSIGNDAVWEQMSTGILIGFVSGCTVGHRLGH